MDAKSIERVVRGAVSTVLTRIVERRQTSGNRDRDNSESEVEDHQPAIQNSTKAAKKKRCSYIASYTSYKCSYMEYNRHV